MKSEIRKDYIQEKYVIIAPKRGKRKHAVPKTQPKPKKETCYFCPKNLKKEEIIKLINRSPSTRSARSGTKSVWDFAVLTNLFPAVSKKNPKAYGIQELIIETPHPTKQLEDLPVPHITKLLKLYADRTREIYKDKKIQYILMFKNNGGRAGATAQHSHSQIFATAFLPPHLQDKSEKVLEYKLRYGTCVYCDVIKKEKKSPRFVAEKNGVIAFTPYASMYNYEIWILPERHLDNITKLNEKERTGWAYLLKKTLAAISELGLPYNYFFHEVVFDQDQHLYMKITPRGSVWAGLEIGSGLVINSVAPEEAARYYRKAFKG